GDGAGLIQEQMSRSNPFRVISAGDLTRSNRTLGILFGHCPAIILSSFSHMMRIDLLRCRPPNLAALHDLDASLRRCDRRHAVVHEHRSVLGVLQRTPRARWPTSEPSPGGILAVIQFQPGGPVQHAEEAVP